MSATSGDNFSFSTSFTQGDALVSNAPTVGAVGALSSQTSWRAAGSAGDLAGTIGQDGAVAVTVPWKWYIVLQDNS